MRGSILLPKKRGGCWTAPSLTSVRAPCGAAGALGAWTSDSHPAALVIDIKIPSPC